MSTLKVTNLKHEDSSSNNISLTDTGNVGIGTTSPGSAFEVKPSASLSTIGIQAGTINSDSIRIQAGGTANTYLEYRGYLGHAWFVDSTERMRITSSGQILADGLTAGISPGITAKRIGLWTPSSNSSISWNSGSSSPSNAFTAWYDLGTNRLQVTDADFSHGVVLNQNSNSWGSYSDARLKENIELLGNSLEKVKAIQPRGFTWKSTGDYDIGFVAQELKLIVPEAVDGNEDDFQVDEETGITHGAMSVKTDKLIPILTAALQEAIAKIETLEAKVAALESTT